MNLAWVTVVATAVLSSVPASAHCYSIWHYKFPQRCGTARHEARHEARAEMQIIESARDWYVEITKLPALPSLADFADGKPDEIAKGRLLLRGKLQLQEKHND